MSIRMDYVRLESEQDKQFYSTPPLQAEGWSEQVTLFLDKLREESAAFHTVGGWAVSTPELQRAAEIFARVVREVFDAPLSLEDEDALHLDVFLNWHLIAEEVRPLFDGARVREGLSDAQYQEFAERISAISIPAEEALYYFLGAYWGEWLVRHRGAVWMLHAPLKPLQAFPDMITSNGTVCLHPFSQVLKKIADPVGDNLAYKSGVFHNEYVPPYPLIASMADRHEATLALMPEEVRLAQQATQQGDAATALTLLQKASERAADNLLVLIQLQQTAWQAQEWEVVHQALTSLLRQHPHARSFYNLGVFYAQFDLFDEAVECMRQAILLNPHYGRAKLTMAALVAEQGEIPVAKALLEQVLNEGYDSAIQEEAQRLMLELQ
ncbi:tetratricopeptide repeat protein [Tumebacillus permanentifrigoris]|uniref:Tetratricopeptide repeat protein n=1 Tax=Tumebacillus permanentifrigoris TaxID=378543 RepID=A0A316DA08_9BACL|nr:tetratricopeptide repeat protein [Tumebacillus permanentifrigoris]PWK13463.1 tetratricopeptide repeat protein [Tumebacillus permanentifrigoris]